MANTAPTQELSKFRHFIQGKTRIVLAWIFSILLILSARDYPTLPGIVICFIGATIRYLASGYLRKDRLVSVGGPYRFCRNPLYFGTYLMGIGTAVAVQNYWLAGAATILFGWLYTFIIIDEEVKLESYFGDAYRKYKDLVPKFFPRLWPPNKAKLLEINPNEDQLAYSHELAWKNKAYEAYAAFGALIGLVAGIAYLWRNVL